jgi:Rps23 Pro-64 3,4-dihydroxylase Tpa1-like proline 4-hydroxylase
LTVYQYGWRDWLGPHLDKADRRVVQIFYFTDNWTEHDGGHLHILRERDSEQPYGRVPPRAGGSAVICPTNHGWHEVEPVSRPTVTRRSMIARFVIPGL